MCVYVCMHAWHCMYVHIPCALLMVMANATRTGNCLRDNLKGKRESEGHKIIRGINTLCPTLGPLNTSPIVYIVHTVSHTHTHTHIVYIRRRASVYAVCVCNVCYVYLQ